jgi:CRISPR-associated endonuclease/helicase Cas3
VCRIDARERLRARTDHVKKGLDALLKAHRKKDSERDFPVVLLNERGTAEWARLSEVSADESKLRYRTVVLPTEPGGLDEHGMLDGKTIVPIRDIDVADVNTESGRRERWLQVRTAGGESYRRLLTDEEAEPPSELRERERIPVKVPQEGAEDEGEAIHLVLLESPGAAALENPEAARVQQTLAEHTEAIVKRMGAIAERLGLEQVIKDALVSAARWHDRGKDRRVWQRFAQNDNGAEPLAKSTRYLHGRALGGYRHEFGSVLDAAADAAFDKLNDGAKDLVVHLVAAHHGWARPHFEARAYDNEEFTTAQNEAAVVEVMRRFGRLQQRFGRWGLAWLESLLRCADIAASKQAIASPNAAVGSSELVSEEVEA